VHAVIDISARVFPVPLIGACIVLLEKCPNQDERLNNRTVFMYLDISRGNLDVNEVLELLERARSGDIESSEHLFPSGARALVRAYKQGDLLKYEDRLINLIFRADEVLDRLRRHPLLTSLATYFEPSRGNTSYSYLASKGVVRGTRDVGGEEFFYLNEEEARKYGIPRDYLYPLLPSSDYMKFFTFIRDDWEEIRRAGKECYLFLAHKPRDQLPGPVRIYVELGEKDAEQGGIALTKGKNRGRAVALSAAAQVRRKYRQYFYDWYDPGGALLRPQYMLAVALNIGLGSFWQNIGAP